ALSSDVSLASPRAGDYRIDGGKTQDGAGWSVATSPDLNGDGIGDVLLGAPGVDRPSGPTLAPAPNSVGPQESNVAAVGIPGWDSNQQSPPGTGRDRGVAILLNGVTDAIAPTITITSPIDGARS